MNPLRKAGVAIAAVVVVAFVGYNLLPGQPTGDRRRLAPTSIVTAPPSATPSPSASVRRDGLRQRPGLPVAVPGRAGHLPRSSRRSCRTRRRPATPNSRTWRRPTGSGRPGNPPGGFFIFRDPAPSTDTNGCEGDPNPAIGALTVDTISSAFAADKRFQVTTPAPVTIGPYSGKTFDLQLAPTWTGTCPWSNGQPGAMVLTVHGGPTPTSPSYGIARHPSLRVYLDVAGVARLDPGRQVHRGPGPAGPSDASFAP